MFDLPTLIFQLAIADLRRLATDTGETRVRGRDVAVGRKLVSAVFRHLRLNSDPDAPHQAAIREIALLATAFTTRHLEAVHAKQNDDPTYRLSSTDLAAMSLYQRALKLEKLMEELGDIETDSQGTEPVADQAAQSKPPGTKSGSVVHSAPDPGDISEADAEIDRELAAVLDDYPEYRDPTYENLVAVRDLLAATLNL
jgi:hypothetical protein